MPANSFGRLFTMHSFGESHGEAMGVVVDGCPSGIEWDQELLLQQLSRRKPGQKDVQGSVLVSERQESDDPEVLSGVYQGKTLGTPIAMLVRNRDQRSQDYTNLADRAGHADDVWRDKFGHTDPRGGGRSSGRETVSRVMAGSVAQMLLRKLAPELQVLAFSKSISSISLSTEDEENLHALWQKSNFPQDSFTARFPSQSRQDEVAKLLAAAKLEGKSHGGIAEVWIRGAPRGLGQPVFHKLKSDLAAAMMSVGATSGVEFGAGFAASSAEGSAFHQVNNVNKNIDSDVYGGIRGGISTGDEIRLRVAFKPTSSVLDVAKKGRHDPCILPRAVPVLEAMAYLVLADHYLASTINRTEREF